jgi:hypothetical protein
MQGVFAGAIIAAAISGNRSVASRKRRHKSSSGAPNSRALSILITPSPGNTTFRSGPATVCVLFIADLYIGKEFVAGVGI